MTRPWAILLSTTNRGANAWRLIKQRRPINAHARTHYVLSLTKLRTRLPLGETSDAAQD